jgi:hypothetical protein
MSAKDDRDEMQAILARHEARQREHAIDKARDAEPRERTLSTLDEPKCFCGAVAVVVCDYKGRQWYACGDAGHYGEAKVERIAVFKARLASAREQSWGTARTIDDRRRL